MDAALTLAPAADDWRDGGFGLYVHWPFCQSKCPYCDFNSHVALQIDHDRWRRAYVAEIARLAAETPGRVLNSIFFGGGTPSLMAPETVAAVIEAARAWPFANDIEITLEANPGSVEAGRFRAYRDAGVNRISMGVQAMNDADLRRLGRLHSVAEAEAAFATARDLFERVSFDLIYARQYQTLADWRAELGRALALAVDHLSLYQLTVEDGTVFGARHAKGQLRGLPEDALSADLYALTQEMTAAAGLPGYEVSNHARPGSESRHNLIYWRYGDYAGVGPGAHGRLTLPGGRWATEAPRAPGAWLDLVERTGRGEQPRERLSGTDQATEYLLMSLRLHEGSAPERFAALAGRPINSSKINTLQEDGLLRPGPRLAVTDQGRILLNAVLRELLAD